MLSKELRKNLKKHRAEKDKAHQRLEVEASGFQETGLNG